MCHISHKVFDLFICSAYEHKTTIVTDYIWLLILLFVWFLFLSIHNMFNIIFMFPQVKKDNPHGLPMYPEGKINARSILATVTEAKHHVLSIVQANKKLKQVSFKTLVNLPYHKKGMQINFG